MKVLIGIVVVLVGLLGYRWWFGVSREYERHLKSALSQEKATEDTSSEKTISKEQLMNLPTPLKRYFEYTGIVGSQRVTHFKLILTGQMKMTQDGEWAPVKVTQYSFVQQGKRLFMMDMKYKGLNIKGLHYFHNGGAQMTIRILDLIQVAHNEGIYMKKGETVTWFNDMCIFAPGALLEADVTWEEIDENHVKGTLTEDGISVTAILTIDDEGRLIDFISEDRYMAQSDGTYLNLPWSTPMSDFAEFHGLRLGSEGAAVWHFEKEDFDYIKLRVEDVIINP